MTHRAQEQDPRWQAVVQRDASVDFFYAVETTGVFCRPGCPSRRPRRDNVSFHQSAEAALRAGFRPCKRCHPVVDPQVATVAKLCHLIDDGEGALTTEQLAAEVGWSPSHAHRVFKRVVGLTPKAYAKARRAERMQAELRGGASVTDAIYAAGYGSSSRFYEESGAMLGMTPRAYRAGGKGQRLRYAFGESALGLVLVAATDKGVAALYLGDDREALSAELLRGFPGAELAEGDEELAGWVARAVAMVDEPRRAETLPLDVRGTAFQRRVWQALQEIPLGQTRTYSELATELGKPRAFRAVAHACAVNEVSVAIPCHRVLRKSGALAGYRWGLERKRQLLDREADEG